jgi:type II secretory pathway pseudopilin PulG
MGARARAGGFTYLGILSFVALAGVLLSMAGGAWQAQMAREREEELLFVGDQYRKAIAGYYAASRGIPGYPRELSDLLKDPRQPGTVRHLRKLYPDPMGAGEWGLVRAPDGGIAGVFSRSGQQPLKTAGFSQEYAGFEGRRAYAEWRFVFPRDASALPAAAPSGGRPGI